MDATNAPAATMAASHPPTSTAAAFAAMKTAAPLQVCPTTFAMMAKPQLDPPVANSKTMVSADGPLFSALQPTHATT